jgi:signal transduction histidine kinase
MQLITTRKRRKTLLNTKPILTDQDIFKVDNFYYEEISNLTEAGGWSVDFLKKTSFFDKQARRILEVPENFRPTLKEGHKFYAKEHLELAIRLFFDCSQGTSFHQEIKMMTYTGTVFWAKAHGTPLRDDSNQIIGIRGVFQNINEEKEKEIKLQQSLDIIEGHNKRLYNFAHIVSHDLRSHVSNLQLSATLFETDNLNPDQLELFGNFEKIGQSLDVTLGHLNEIVTIQSTINKELKPVHFDTILESVKASINQRIVQTKTTIYTEFSEVEEVDYVPEYLKSILLNLITNALKFKHPERDPEINIFTYKEDGITYLAVKDNGIGMDLEKYGEKIFKMYTTLNTTVNSQGLGLFLIKSQVESLGGNITVESKLGKFTKFTVQLSV